MLGNGLAVIDFGSRVNHVRNSYNAGSNWERDLFIESSSFTLSALTASLTINGGLALLVFATPFGWAALIAGGLIIAGTSAAAATSVNSAVEGNAGGWYDSIMKSIGGR